MTTQQVIDYYTGLLILQYAALANAVRHMQAVIGTFVQNQIIVQVRDGFDLASALGAQLNILGKYRGANREVFGVTPGNDWSLVPAADASPGSYLGWVEASDPNPSWNWLLTTDLNSVPHTLSDTQLRRLIALRAALQSSALGLADLDNILYSVFGSYVNVVDNANMSIVYQHNHLDPDIDGLWGIAVLSNSLPAPAGVSFTVVEV